MFTVLSLWRGYCHASLTKGSLVINSVYRFLAILKWKISVSYEMSFLVVFNMKSFLFLRVHWRRIDPVCRHSNVLCHVVCFCKSNRIHLTHVLFVFSITYDSSHFVTHCPWVSEGSGVIPTVVLWHCPLRRCCCASFCPVVWFRAEWRSGLKILLTRNYYSLRFLLTHT